MRSSRKPYLLFGGSVAVAAALAAPQDAAACGCFAPPDPSVPIVQAGERIIFAHDGEGNVVAHIQIQYKGEPQDFGWLLPLPSVPELELGVEEVFAQVVNTTQPKYRLNQLTGELCEFGFPGRFAPTSFESDSNAGGVDDMGPAVVVSSIGPYDYAVLRADSRTEMFDWLTNNRYFIPTGTEDVVGPYIRPGAYFLALKLRKGNNAGDIQPVVLKYSSDRAMIPIILTSVAADPNMGVQVWVLGQGRAIPLNYRHTILNEEWIDWFSAGTNYNDVVINATNEAPEGQTFVTEYAGDNTPMLDVLDWQGRFGTRSLYEAQTDAGMFVSMMRGDGFRFDSSVTNILKSFIPMPDALVTEGLTEDQYYQSLDYYLRWDRERRPEIYEGLDFSFDARALTNELWTRIVTPTLAAGQLFRSHPWMTRLYTTLSAEEMTRDPVFSFNPGLPPVSNVHEATFEFLCTAADDQANTTPGILTLPDGRRFYVTEQTSWAAKTRPGVPYSRRIELLREEGAPEIEVDNTPRITPSEPMTEQGGCGCSATSEAPARGAWALGVLAVALVMARRKWS